MAMKQGRNPTRRNRNIGTSKQGHGRNNRMRIPKCLQGPKLYYEQLHHPVVVARNIGDKEIQFLVEAPQESFLHPCTVDDLAKILAGMVALECDLPELIVLRQPTKKQNQLDPVWGRYDVYSDLGGPAIFLETLNPQESMEWGRHLTPEDEKELARLREAGHEITEDKRHYYIKPSLNSIRNTQLYFILLHEIGHHVDDNYDKHERDRESFANRYAEEMARKLQEKNVIPFARILDRQSMQRDGLPWEWFTPSIQESGSEIA